MMKDRDEQHYDHEESEYHFSDDDISYEVETEASKPAAPESERKNPLSGLTQSKRMIISLVVFLGLVFVVYKMVSPGSSDPSTDMTPVVAQPATGPAIVPPAIPHTTPSPVAAPAAQPETPPSMATAATPTPATTVIAQQPAQAAPVTTSPPAAAPVPATTTTTTTMQVSPSLPAQVVAPAPVAAAPQAVAPAQPQPVAPMSPPAVASAPVPPAPLATPVTAQPLPPVATTVTTTQPTVQSSTDAAMAALASTNEKLMNQLQAEYSQKVTDMSSQAKAMQDQMQALNSRVAGLESQLSQLVQTLSRQTGMGGNANLNVVPAQPPVPVIESKVSYNVQAIIPGRAWLKSDNGETLTVAEGDTIKELGRVTKIDPYDGVVEVNTGNKTVSISYGSGG